eukprot:TRINITY_DN8077_c0_g1_i2.p1 TRINITY_DN8077_c0_g1~~TRINITY_DN8077_c0_g1_i2.p1  ORF type:complete len:828 (-),score=165.73 TRINITY_DN8077_c0_g1_i2:116-2599(-)
MIHSIFFSSALVASAVRTGSSSRIATASRDALAEELQEEDDGFSLTAMFHKENPTDPEDPEHFACCCQEGYCDKRNWESEHKREIVILNEGNRKLLCCKPRVNEKHYMTGKVCDLYKYTDRLDSIAGTGSGSYSGMCTRQCTREKDCGGHGSATVELNGMQESCKCECDEGYSIDSTGGPCQSCLPGWGLDTDHACHKFCTKESLFCYSRGHANTDNFEGECKCVCQLGYDPEASCGKCSRGYRQVGAGPGFDCVAECDAREYTCGPNEEIVGLPPHCACQCKPGFNPETGCSECLPGKILGLTGECVDMSGLEAIQREGSNFELPAWIGYYAKECERDCGRSKRALLAVECPPRSYDSFDGGAMVYRLKTTTECDQTTYPAQYLECTSTARCLFEKSTPPEGNCGWHKVKCLHYDTKAEAKTSLCEDHYQSTLHDWQVQNALEMSGCSERPLEKLCSVTMNEHTPKHFTLKVKKIVEACAGADVITIATQETTTHMKVAGAMFSKSYNFPDIVTAFEEKGYVTAGYCYSILSAGVGIFVKPEKRQYFAPELYGGKKDEKACFFETESSQDDAATNTKGSTILSIPTVMGLMVAASTHADRGPTMSDGRVQLFHGTTKYLMVPGPALITWGGDFNQRVAITDSDMANLMKYGQVDDPDPQSPKNGQKGPVPKELQPERVYELLKGKPDILGRHMYTTEQELEFSTGGRLQQVDGIWNHCPTYRKDNPGVYKGWSRTWNGNLACKGPGDEHIQYYNCCKYQGASSRSPSWTERIFVDRQLKAGCQEAKKIFSDEDHDMLYVQCEVPTIKEIAASAHTHTKIRNESPMA